MIKRSLTTLIEEALLDTPALFVNGARQVGKSILVKMITENFSHIKYITFDDPTFLAAAKADPLGFIAALGDKVVIDEAQRAPEIFLPNKKLIDEQRRPGKYLLTGSANILT